MKIEDAQIFHVTSTASEKIKKEMKMRNNPLTKPARTSALT